MELIEIYERAINRKYRVSIAQAHKASTILITLRKSNREVTMAVSMGQLRSNTVMRGIIKMMEKELQEGDRGED